MLTLLFLGAGCYYVDVSMKSSKTMPGQRYRILVINLLLVGLLFSSATSRDATIQARQTEEKPGPTSIRSGKSVLRNHALTTFSGQPVVADHSKQNRGKHSVIYSVLASAKVSAPAAILRERLVTTDRSVLYLSFRLSRPGGRAPPASA
jgi:hypothetical protein